ncbi:MAG: hypothetical protein RL693_296, partial [Verrucomicrobiota bacterium]
MKTFKIGTDIQGFCVTSVISPLSEGELSALKEFKAYIPSDFHDALINLGIGTINPSVILLSPEGYTISTHFQEAEYAIRPGLTKRQKVCGIVLARTDSGDLFIGTPENGGSFFIQYDRRSQLIQCGTSFCDALKILFLDPENPSATLENLYFTSQSDRRIAVDPRKDHVTTSQIEDALRDLNPDHVFHTVSEKCFYYAAHELLVEIGNYFAHLDDPNVPSSILITCNSDLINPADEFWVRLQSHI